MRKSLVLVAALALSAPVLAQHGALTIPRNLAQLTDRAAVIVRGNVVSARVEKHPQLSGLDTVVVTLRIRQSLKGAVADTYTFRQHLRDTRDVAEAGGYRKGQDLLILMIAPSQYGLSSPAGLAQGRFRIERDAAGTEIAVNGHANFRLFDGIAAKLEKQGTTLSLRSRNLVERRPAGPVALADLSGLIRELAEMGD